METAASEDHGSSGKSLYQKLGFQPAMRIWLHGAPKNYQHLLGGGEGLDFVKNPDNIHVAHIFVREASLLPDLLQNAMSHIIDKGFIWVSWPKKASHVETNLDENKIRDLAISLGWVDTKVCAVDATWSGLKLMKRRKL